MSIVATFSSRVSHLSLRTVAIAPLMLADRAAQVVIDCIEAAAGGRESVRYSR